VRPDLFRQGVDFVRNFADRCHHAKEEENLFPRMEARGVPRDGGPIGVMLFEHEEGRAYVRAIAGAIDDYEADGIAAAR
jgi:hemerythrin-like domain-containing protein